MKRKLLSLVLAFCMTLSLVPAASAHWVADGNAETEGVKFKVEYFKPDQEEAVATRYFNNEGNDDWGGTEGKNPDHFWDPITVMGDHEALKGCTKAVVTLFADITLEDTTILVDKGHDVTITSKGGTVHTINCTLKGTIEAGEGGAHKPGMDAISIASDNEGNALTLDKVKVAISGPAAAAAAGEGNNPTQGIYNDGTLTLQNGAEVTVNGVSQNGVNGSGTLAVQGTGTKLSVASVGGSGVKGGSVTVSEGAAISVDGAAYHGVTVDTLSVTGANSKVESKNTTMYGVTAANGITLSDNATISATLKDDATVIAPIHLEKGVFEVSENATVTGNVFLGSDASISGAGSSKVQTVTAVATIGDKPYATLKDAVAAATSTDTIQLLKDVTLTEKLTINKAITLEGNNKTITGQNNSKEVFLEVTGGNVTIQNLKVKDFGGNTGTTGQWGLIKVPEGDGTTEGKLTVKNVTASNFNRAAVDVRKGTFEVANCTFDCANQSESKLTKGVLAQNVTGTISNTTITNAETTYTEPGNAWNTNAIETWGNTTLTITGCTLGTADKTVKNGVSMNTGDGASTVTMSDTTVVATNRIVKLTPKSSTEGAGTSALTIESGKYTGTFLINQGEVAGAGCSITVNGGYFTDDPTPYLAEGKAAVESDVAGYNFMIGEKGDAPADVVAGAPDIAPVPQDITGEDKTLADNVKSALTGGDTGSAPELVKDDSPLVAAARTEANKNTVTEDAGKEALKGAGVNVEAATVSIVIQPYMDIEITAADAGEGTFTLDITPMYRTIATTADVDDGDEIKLEDGTDKNAVEVVRAKELTVTKSVTITLPLPTGFVDTSVNNLYVNHKKDNGPTYVYTGTVENNVLTFVNPHGFSEFSVSKTSSAVAEVEGVSYASLQDAVNAVANNGTIKLLANGSATVSKEISFNVEKGTYTATITPASNLEMKVVQGTAQDTYTFTEKSGGGSSGGGGSSSGGGGGSVVTQYTLTFDTNGGTAISKVTKDKGTKVDLSGYTTTRQGYTFAGWYADEALTDKVTSVTLNSNKTVYAKWTEKTPEKPALPFADVTKGDWFYDAVQYVYDKGMMNGVDGGRFAPNAATSRAMIVTILYRLENEPGVSGKSPFTDVAAGQWYTNAVAWAAANGIVTGTTDTTFAPNGNITREQMAAILYRYASYKGLDVSRQADLSGYADANAISAYAKQAMAWANGQGLITGVTATTLRPDGNAVRAQAATILMRLCEQVL